jgi:peptidoglycan hydrolase-like protein with peptidoglycan-binding domain
MTLQEIATGNSSVDVKLLATDRALAREIQSRLVNLGCLDFPPDGDFGPVSMLVFREFTKAAGLPPTEAIDARLARALLDSSRDTLFPLSLGTDLASRIVKYMQLQNLWFARLPGFLNICYVEGVNKDGSLNANELNKFNDRRIVFTVEAGKPHALLNVEATTEPGRTFTLNPINPKGAARIAFGQYKAWRVGIHRPKPTSAGHEALVQVSTITVHRDLNKDGKRTGDAIDVGSGFGINQHSGHNANVNDIGRTSAGCLVGRSHEAHKEFMRLVKTDPRFKKASTGYTFVTTVIAGDDLKKRIG